MPAIFPDRLTIGLPGNILPPFSSLARNAQRAEERGAAAIWFPDHLMGLWPQTIWTPDVSPLAAAQSNPHTFLDPAVAIGAAAGATNRITLGTSVTPALSMHPALVARTFLSLSHLSGGRVVLGFGSGEAENLTPYGLPFDKPASRTIEALHIIRLLWEQQEPASFDGDFWQLRDAVLGLAPTAEAPAPPIWLAAMGPAMLRAAGRYADGWLPVGLVDAPAYAAGLGTIREAAAAAGRPSDAIVPGLWAYTLVHERESDVQRLLEAPLIKCLCLIHDAASFRRHGAEHPLGANFSGWRDYIPTRLNRETALRAIAQVPIDVVRDFVLAGTPDQIAAQLRQLENAGARHVVLWNVTPFADASLVRQSFDLLTGLMGSLS